MTHNDNLMDLLYTEGVLAAGSKVRTATLNEMEIYGFIPLTYNDNSLEALTSPVVDLTMKSTVIVSDRLSVVYETALSDGNKFNPKYTRTDKREVHPILRYVKLQDNDSHLESLRGLYVPQYKTLRTYIDYRKTVNIRNAKIPNLDRIIAVDEEDKEAPRDPNNPDVVPTIKVAYYKPSEKDLYFCRNMNGKVQAVGEEFVVVCRRLNTVTGNSVLEVFNPEELLPIKEKNEEK